ncbi:MAG: methyltransferase domain-containing protein [Magnetococcus sp. YQC-3]
MIDNIPMEFHPLARLDARRLRVAWQGAAATMAAPDGLLAQAAQPLLERLDDIHLTPARILDLGDRSGLLARQLQKRWPKAEIYAMAYAGPRQRERGLPWRRRPWHLLGTAEQLPFAGGQFDLVISSMALHWSNHLPTVFREIRRVLAADRLLLFTVAGGETLRELHACLAQLDQERYGHPWVRRPELPSLSGLGDLLAASGLVLPVVDRERVVLPIPDSTWLLRQLRAMGAGNHMQVRPGGLLGKGFLHALDGLYREKFSQQDGSLGCTLELLFGHAWKKSQ